MSGQPQNKASTADQHRGRDDMNTWPWAFQLPHTFCFTCMSHPAQLEDSRKT